MQQPLRWAILGTGNIASTFAAQLRECPTAELLAVGSRSPERAASFGARCGCRGGSYDEVLQSKDVDAVYISLPNALHHRWTLRALAAGKHVLCEKPIAANTAEAEEMFDAAQRAGRVLIEAFMYRCHPAIRKLVQMVHDGAIGQLKLIRTHFTFERRLPPDDVRYQVKMAGGSLMDVGCYCISFCRALAGCEPEQLHGVAHLHSTGVDDYAAAALRFPGGVLAVFTCGMTVQADRTTLLGGSDGYLAIDLPWLTDGTFRLVQGETEQQIHEPAPLPLYALEARDFAAVVRGQAEPWITAHDSIGNMRVLDHLRQQVGVRF